MPREPGRGHRRSRPTTGAPAGTTRGRRRADRDADGPPDGTRTEAAPPDDHDPDDGDVAPRRPTRRRATLVALGVTAVVSAAALVAGLPDWSPPPTDPARTLTAAEADRLAAMRVTNQRDVRAGVRVTIGTGRAAAELVGWVDWARPLVYLSVRGPDVGTEQGLVQATRSAMVVRPDPAAASAPPPLVPPADRWRLREPPAGRGVAAVRDLLLGLTAERTDAVPATARWVGRDTVDGSPVDIVETPLPAPPSDPAADAEATAGPDSGTPDTDDPTDGAAPGRPPRLWLDQDARLHRLRGWLPDGVPVTVELARTDRPVLRPVDALGGPPGLPRALADAEADRLAQLSTRLRAAGGATLTLTAPAGPAANLRAAGWVSWAAASAYLAVGEADTPGRRTLLRCRPGRVARVEVPADGTPAEVPAAPPLPPPAGLAWPAARPPGDDALDRLLETALRAGGTAVPAGSAVRLRDDRVAGRVVDVVEVPDGRTALRYWIDRGGLLRRLELRTGRKVWAQLDLTPGRVPALPTAA
ncbi:hypothetical protein [Micromonospora narathiwatensis]|uniref:Uncharacterized protein n=1 Tax=Micromonospora narathiwatensis TaxID=299146 RepID=A0A1A8ZVH6_9ACTN|nr:hypothetical protein [Micromonospora narathiwatensis]SBT47889.1 hypothetical protein GA0070621_3022 [Micromonospora narathiwatensis]